MDPRPIIKALMQVIEDNGCCDNIMAMFKSDPSEKTKIEEGAKNARRAMNDARAFLSSTQPDEPA